MMPYNIMFKVGDTDYSGNVIDSSNGYKVQSDPVYTEWEDANGRIHRSVYRWRRAGQFTLFFKTIQNYEAFCLVMEHAQKADSSYPCVVCYNSKNREVSGDFFVDYDPVRHRTDDLQSDYMAAIAVTIKEC